MAKFMQGKDGSVLLVTKENGMWSSGTIVKSGTTHKLGKTTDSWSLDPLRESDQYWTPVTVTMGVTKILTFADKCADLGTDVLAEAYDILWEAELEKDKIPRVQKATGMKNILKGQRFGVPFETWHKVITFFQSKVV